MADSSTIAAIASPPGPGERGVIRVSGPDAWSICRSVWARTAELPAIDARGFHFGRFDDGRGTQPLMLMWMPGPRSFTREDVAEFHLPGSPPLLDAALERILSLGARSAEAGEFTRRAFENGRIDLTRAEGILELVHARNETERRAATALLLGGLSDRLAPLRDGLAALRALSEASLDFDETDTGHVAGEELLERGARLLDGLEEAAQWEARRTKATDLPRVALVGAPNAGKSSLFNALVPDATALVSDLSGTTRDVLTGTWSVGELDVQLVDTAGLDSGATGPDGDAQRLGARYLANADLLLWLVDPATVTPEDLRAAWGRLPNAPHQILVWTKSDTQPAADLGESLLAALKGGPGLAELPHLPFSSSTLEGREALQRAVVSALGEESPDGAPGVRREREIGVRHQVALQAAAEALQGGLTAFKEGLPLDQFAQHLRQAGAHLDAIHGRTTAEDLLTRIFSSFCIGK